MFTFCTVRKCPEEQRGREKASYIWPGSASLSTNGIFKLWRHNWRIYNLLTKLCSLLTKLCSLLTKLCSLLTRHSCLTYRPWKTNSNTASRVGTMSKPTLVTINISDFVSVSGRWVLESYHFYCEILSKYEIQNYLLWYIFLKDETFDNEKNYGNKYIW